MSYLYDNTARIVSTPDYDAIGVQVLEITPTLTHVYTHFPAIRRVTVKQSCEPSAAAGLFCQSTEDIIDEISFLISELYEQRQRLRKSLEGMVGQEERAS